MTVGIKTLVDCTNASIASDLSSIQILQMASVERDIEIGSVYSVANCAALPDASLNTGRMAYLLDRCSYRVSDGLSWTCDFSSNLTGTPQIWVWGGNASGILGDGTTVNKSSPVSVVGIGGITDWCKVNVGFSAIFGLRKNGTLWSWGSGPLGDGTTTLKTSPVSVVGGFTDWCKVSGGGVHTLGLRSDGTIWSWGTNTAGQLGDNTATTKCSPVSVVGGFTDWCQISAGDTHSLAIRTNGTLWGWGYNSSGALGANNTVWKSSPVSAVGGFTDWCQVSAGAGHSLGLRTNGTAWGWGYNYKGRVGDGTENDRSSPVSVVGGFTDWCQVSAGNNHSIGLRTNGTIWAWGYNLNGSLGIGDATHRSSPVSVVGGFTDWCQVDAGADHTLAVRTNGTIWAWGGNAFGQLADNTGISRSSPVSAVGVSDWYQVSAGGCRTVAIRLAKGF